MKRWLMIGILISGGGVVAMAQEAQTNQEKKEDPEGTEVRQVTSSEELFDPESEQSQLLPEAIPPQRIGTIEGKHVTLRGVGVQFYEAPKNLEFFHLFNPMAPDHYFPQEGVAPRPEPWAFTDPRRDVSDGFKLFSIGF